MEVNRYVSRFGVMLLDKLPFRRCGTLLSRRGYNGDDVLLPEE